MKLNAISKFEGRIFCLGEALWDIIFHDSLCTGGQVGGAMLNSGLTLSACGLPVEFISMLSTDRAGSAILAFLAKNGIGTKFLLQSNELKSTLALAFINHSGDAEYTFYKDSLPDFDFKLPPFSQNDILLFGSGWAREEKLFKPLHRLLQEARRNSTMVIYDPNYRKRGSSSQEIVQQISRTNIAAAHLVRGSDEDFFNMFGCKDGASAYQQVQNCGCEYLIYTKSGSLIECYFGDDFVSLPVEKITVVNTVGAGDNFNAGIIAYFAKHQVLVQNLRVLKADDWLAVLKAGRSFGSAACLVKEGFLAQKTAEELLGLSI